MLSKLVIAFLLRSKCLNFMVTVSICSDFGAQENKVCHYFLCFTIYLPWSDFQMPWSEFFECWVLSQLFFSLLSRGSSILFTFCHKGGIVNKSIQNAVLGCNLKNDRMISVHFQGKRFNITVIQVYVPTTDEEAEAFYDDLQYLLELTLKKMSFTS